MRVKQFVFDGYPGGNSDFAARYEAMEDERRRQFDEMLRTVSRALHADAISQPYVAITLIGCSDRQDRAGMSHQQAQASEAKAALDRVDQAFTWVSERITALSGVPEETWKEESGKVTWALVPAGSGFLEVPNPANEQDRLKNRRVVILFSHFEIMA